MAKEYRAEQHITITGSECGTETEVTQVVTFTVTKGYPETRLTPAEPDTVDDIVIRHFVGNPPAAHEIELSGRIVADFEESDEFKAWLLGCANEAEQELSDEAADRDPDEFSGFAREVIATVANDPARD